MWFAMVWTLYHWNPVNSYTSWTLPVDPLAASAASSFSTSGR